MEECLHSNFELYVKMIRHSFCTIKINKEILNSVLSKHGPTPNPKAAFKRPKHLVSIAAEVKKQGRLSRASG